MSKNLKRKILTSDDLMRRLEEPGWQRKRPRLTTGGSGENDDAFTDFEDSEEDEEGGSDDEGGLISPDSHLGNRHISRLTVQPPLEPKSVDPPVAAQDCDDFSSLGISDPLVLSMISMSIRRPTPVQAACIPCLLEGRDCIGNAKTGSGKTVAFALPILQKLSLDPYGIFALVLTPTRELAFQISDQFTVLGSPLNLRTAVVVGGMDMMAQAIELGNRPHVVIATPGRIVDHLRSSNGEWDLSRIKFLILDEADRLLTETFSSELSHLFSVIPKDRQTGLFTATLTPAIEALAEAVPRPGKQKPFIYRMTASVETVDTLKQSYILVPSHVREPYLYYLLCNPPESIAHLRRAPPEPVRHSRYKKLPSKPKPSQSKKKKLLDEENTPEQPPPTIIFCKRPYTAAYLTHVLQELSIRATSLHSRLTQRERLNSLSLFRAYVVPVLISTDVGARGLDIEDVAMVINWDVPDEPEEYTHRVGRTARKGKGGVAVSFVTERDEEKVAKVEARINTKLTEMTLPEEKVLEKLNAVSTAKRLANMELHDSDFGKREKIHKMKRDKRDKR
ncbi:P-loop containing nucleoside triphosphate hydrolase protein [Gautieria morchelliformis]|nr:P-loop containing nucleoside triphosphate hydrolase protein [Gautieria morchelliformis]